MPNFDPEALRAAAESARRKSEMGSNATDQLAPQGSIVIAPDSPAGATVDLTTTYMGLRLRNPVVASAGPLSQTLDGIRELDDGGVGAIVMYSLFEEQIRYEDARQTAIEEQGSDSFAEALSYFPTTPSNESGLTRTYLSLIEKAAPTVSVPLIASLNGSTTGDWTNTARRMQDAGASAIELNVYYVAGDLHTPAREVEERHLDILAAVKQVVSVPVAMKLSPYFSSFGEMAGRLDAAGADAFVLFNRYLQPDIDLDRMAVVPGFGLSGSDEAKLPRSWIAALYGRVGASLAATTGVETVEDVLKYLLAGADVVMTTASLVRHGPGHAGQLVDGVTSWLTRKGLTLDKARGMLAVPSDVDGGLYARSGYVSGLERAKKVYGRN
ncbi:dihydroorotate dehydrogenase-like protein [Brooklawnia cerclae]|uniref:Dihydroorotate dehydrogenase (Fumarate) n=1 Tax=Brooklawnia cerclae TaxID=349934 RepID=A0ABX0SIJ6_9ACTN|nr:dihydroorotate dehydrogenase-like protein [Brooklawnia cerclae]NIH58218.1 dihydroorotate dehydrogenase (fumarate) [Brooklawnia cerclae]